MCAHAERAAASTPHVCVDEDGVAWIDHTNVKVVEVVLDKLTHGWSSEDLEGRVELLPLR